MVSVSTVLMGLAQLATIVIASPIALERRAAPEYCGSGGFSRVAALLNANSATAFCSEYLAIPTVTVPATQTLQTYTTVTATIDQYESTTQTVATETLRFTVSTTVATVPSTVATSIITSISTATSTVTPARVTTTTTVWYTAGVAKREEVRRAAQVPTYLNGFAPPAISSACKCLDIPSPSVTATETVYNPNTVNTEVTKTITNTVHATLTISSTSTVRLTSYVPITSISTQVSVTTITTTTATPTFTSTVSSAFRPQCTALLSRPKLYTAVQPLRSYSYPFATSPIPNGGLNEPTFSQCCELCYRSTNCGQFYTYQASPGNWRCQIITSYTQVSTGITAQCPLGRVNGEGVSGPAAWTPSNQARGIGPCYGYNVPI